MNYLFSIIANDNLTYRLIIITYRSTNSTYRMFVRYCGVSALSVRLRKTLIKQIEKFKKVDEFFYKKAW
jgi:hypothetical protein